MNYRDIQSNYVRPFYLDDPEPEMQQQAPKGYLPLYFGTRIQFTIAGGPYRHCPDGYIGVNMAAEIDKLAMIKVPTQDFNVPDMDTFQRGVIEACVATVLGFPVYVGCQGGIGRTGLFLAGMAKVSMYLGQSGWGRLLRRQASAEAVIAYVRSEYFSHALETPEQEAYVEAYDPRPAAAIVRRVLKIDLK